jgi:hypothetical protein
MQELKDNFIQESDPFFAKLDQESKTLRDAAKDFADFLVSSDVKLPTKQQLINSLNEIYSTNIEKIDLAIDAVKRDMLMTSAQIEKEQKSTADKEQVEQLAEQVETFLDKNRSLLEATDAFIERALALNDELNK